MPLFLGLDAGTSSFKAALFDESGRLVARASEEYTLATPYPNRVEYEAEEYWRMLCRVVSAAIVGAHIEPSAVVAMAISSQGETMVCVDRAGSPVGKAIVWLDNRSPAEAEVLSSELGSQRVYEVTGQPQVVSTWPATKILWLRRNTPSLFRQTARFLLLEDYLILRLTGRYVGERSLYSSSMLLDIGTGALWKDVLDILGIDESRLPALYDSGVLVGNVCADACASAGLSPNTLVVTGALDQAAGMVGSGNAKKGVVTESTGTCLAVCASTGESHACRPGSRIPQHYGVVPRTYYSLLWSPTAGAVLRWFRDTFYAEALADPSRRDGLYDRMVSEAACIPPGSDGLLVCPHLSGSGFPDFDSRVRGAFVGLTLRHTRGHLVRAILESIAFLLRQSIEAVEALGSRVDEIRSIGGGASSGLWTSIKADVTGKDIVAIGNPEPTCLGAALLAGVGSGFFPSLEAACGSVGGAGLAVRPTAETRRSYEGVYRRFLSLSSASGRLPWPALTE